MSGVWKTKYGLRKVKKAPPTLEEAIFAAQGLTGDVQQQVEIAASLMDLPPDRVRLEVLKSAARRTETKVAFSGRGRGQRTIVVERKPSRRLGSARPA